MLDLMARLDSSLGTEEGTHLRMGSMPGILVILGMLYDIFVKITIIMIIFMKEFAFMGQEEEARRAGACKRRR